MCFRHSFKRNCYFACNFTKKNKPSGKTKRKNPVRLPIPIGKSCYESIFLTINQSVVKAKNIHAAGEETQMTFFPYVFDDDASILDILFLSNHNIHKSLCGLCFWASNPLIEGDY